MTGLSLGAVLRAAVLAGLGAALVVSAFHSIVTEPLIDHAIALEAQMSAGRDAHEAPLVSRDTQRAGLVVGFVLYGLAAGLFAALVLQLGSRWLPGSTAAAKGVALGVLAYWSLALVPFLKYPANPPGVGDPETIASRQSLYLALLGLSVAVAAVSLALSPWFGRVLRSSGRGWLASLLVLAIFDAAIFVALPEHADPIHMPLDVVWSFRAVSLVGLTLFWVTLAVVFGVLLRQPRPEAMPSRSLPSGT